MYMKRCCLHKSLGLANAPINSKVQHPPRANPRAYELLKIVLFKFPPLGAKKPFKCPINLYCNTSTQRQISSSIKHFTRFSERYAVMTPPKRLLKTLLKELFTNNGEILSCKSVKLREKRKKLTGVLRQNKR